MPQKDSKGDTYMESIPPNAVRAYVGVSTTRTNPQSAFTQRQAPVAVSEEDYHSDRDSSGNDRLFEELKSLPQRLRHMSRSSENKSATIFAGEELSISQPITSVKAERGENALEFLEESECIVISSYLDSFELGFDRDMINPWQVTDISGNIIYFIGESYRGPCCNYFSYNRPFKFNVLSLGGSPIFHIVRKCNFLMCCLGSRTLGNNVYVLSSITHQKLGYIKQECDGSRRTFVVWDENAVALFRIEEREDSRKKILPWRIFQIKEIPSEKLIATLINRLARKSQSNSFEILSSSQYTLAFDEILKPDKKAILLGAAFCIIITYFEPGGPSGEYSDKWACCTPTGICISSVALVVFSVIVVVCVIVIQFHH